MKYNFTTVVLIALVILNILDGDFTNPSWLDYIKFILLAIALVLSIAERRKD